MIKNQKQAASAKQRLADLLKSKAEIEAKKREYEPLEYDVGMNSLNELIKTIEKEIKLYDQLIAGNFECFKANSLEDIPDALVAARLAQKMSQKDLGSVLGLKEQQIQRYEATDYETASWARIVQIALALKLKFVFPKIIIDKSTKDISIFAHPATVSIGEVIEAEEKICTRHLLTCVS